ncbi:MAG: glycosyltransferase [Cyclobacteriaceae bacterium]|nr:glycosyltransferase [Cyclobacteriaceae bacterium]
MNDPFFSLIIPTYNRAEHILKAITSLLNQTFVNFQIIIVDDGSTDNSQQVLSTVKDRRVSVYYKVNEERGMARNFGASKAIGNYVSFLDSDDIAYPDYLQTAYEIISKLKSPEVLHTDYEFQDQKGNKFPHGLKLPELLNDHLLNNNAVSVIGVFIRRDIFVKHQFLNHRSAVLAEDLYLWLTLASRYKFHHWPSVTSAIVLHLNRSVNDLNAFKFLKSGMLIINALSDDETFVNFYSSRRVNYFFAKKIANIALLFIEEGNIPWSVRLLQKSIGYSWRIIFNKTFLATIKRVILNFFK